MQLEEHFTTNLVTTKYFTKYLSIYWQSEKKSKNCGTISEKIVLMVELQSLIKRSGGLLYEKYAEDKTEGQYWMFYLKIRSTS